MGTPKSEFTINNDNKRFELTIDGLTVFADYKKIGRQLYLYHVEAPHDLRGTGAAGKLMTEILRFSKREQLAIVPICSYATYWLKKHRQISQK